MNGMLTLPYGVSNADYCYLSSAEFLTVIDSMPRSVKLITSYHDFSLQR